MNNSLQIFLDSKKITYQTSCGRFTEHLLTLKYNFLYCYFKKVEVYMSYVKWKHSSGFDRFLLEKEDLSRKFILVNIFCRYLNKIFCAIFSVISFWFCWSYVSMLWILQISCWILFLFYVMLKFYNSLYS